MAARKSKKTPEPFTFNPLWLKVGGGLFLASALILGICYFEGVNRQVQTDRKFLEDPSVSDWYRDAKQLVGHSSGSANASGSMAPVAIWYGKVEERKTSNPRSGESPELLAVKLGKPRLMAGNKGRLDKRNAGVIISTRNSSVAPQVGEEWIFSVWRDEQGYNHTKSACYYRRSGS